MFGTTTTISSTSNKNQQPVSAKHVSGTRAKMKYHTLSTSSIASEGKKSTLTIYADMDLNHDKLESELVVARRELEDVQKALHKQTQLCRKLVAEFSRKLKSKDLQIRNERQLRDQQLTKVLRALLLFEARLVQEQKIIRQQLNEKDNIIRYQQIQIRKLQAFNENYCQSSNLESLESSSDLYGFQETNNRYNQNGNRVSNFESLDSSSEIYATVSEKDYKHDNSTSSEDAGNKTDCDSLSRGGTYVKNKQNYTKLNDIKRTKKYGNNRKGAGTYIESLRRRESCIDSSSNDEVSSNEHESEMRNMNGNVNEHIDKVSQRIENIFTDTKGIVTTSHKFSEKMDNLHGIKTVRHSREASDEAYTSSSISGSSSSTSTNYCSPGDIRGSYEPNGNFNCNSSTKSESELTTTYSESTKHNDGGDSVSLEIYELNGDIYDNARTVDKNRSNNNNNAGEKQHPADRDNNVSTTKCKNHFQNSADNRFIFDKNDSESNENWYASASDQEEDQKCEIYKNNPVLECMNQILLHNIHDPINSPPKSPVPVTKSKSPKRVKFFDENNGVVETKHLHSEVGSPSKKSGNCVNSVSPAPSQESNYYETPIQGVANVYEVPQSIYSNDYEQILINCNDGFQSWPSSMKNNSPGKIENLQEKEINRMAQQKLSVAKNSNFDNLDNKNNYYYVDMDSRVIDNRTGQSIIRKCKLSRTPPALPPKPANLVSKYKIQTRKFNEHHEHVDNMTNTMDIEPDYCSISELNLAVDGDSGQICDETVQQNSSNISSLYDQIIANASNTQQNKTLKQVSTERNVSMPTNTHTKSKESKTSKTLDIPMLPQVSEIIIPSESESEAKEECITQDNYIKNNSQMLKQKSSKSNSTVHDKYKSPIQIGVSVSSLITGFNNQHILSEINNRKPTTPKNKLPEHVFSNFEQHQNYDKQQTPSRSSDNSNSSMTKSEIPSFEKFDLSQNFEEFRLDDCEIGEEYHISMDNEDKEHDRSISNVDQTTSLHSVEKEQNKSNEATEKSESRNLNTSKKHLSVSVENILGLKTVPGLNPNRNGYQKPTNSIQHSISSTSKRSPSKVPVLKSTSSFLHQKDNYEQFLECTGLSSKSILTPSRLLSNHKAMLKPKDVKLRDRVRSTVVEKHGSTVKYYSEPYL